MAELHEQMIQIFRQVFPDIADASDEAVSKYQREGSGTWDSMRHLLLITCIEDGLGVQIPAEETLNIDSYQGAMSIVSTLHH